MEIYEKMHTTIIQYQLWSYFYHFPFPWKGHGQHGVIKLGVGATVPLIGRQGS